MVYCEFIFGAKPGKNLFRVGSTHAKWKRFPASPPLFIRFIWRDDAIKYFREWFFRCAPLRTHILALITIKTMAECVCGKILCEFLYGDFCVRNEKLLALHEIFRSIIFNALWGLNSELPDNKHLLSISAYRQTSKSKISPSGMLLYETCMVKWK